MQQSTSRVSSMLTVVIAAFGLLTASTRGAAAHNARKLIACSPFVYPCQCGLCPHIVDCTKTTSAECFCGTAAPGTYPHPQDKTKFWMCSYDAAAHVKYGVEVPCPARLLFDHITKVCTFPQVLAQSQITAGNAVATAPAARKPVANTNVQSRVNQDNGSSTQKVLATQRATAARIP